MTDELSPTQALALWGLLARQGRAPAAEVKPKADRDALVAGGFAEGHKPSKTLSLTDRGWNWADTHLDAPALEKQPVLTLLLGRLGAHLKAGGGTLAAFIGEAPPLPEPAVKQRAVKTKAPPTERTPPKPRAAPKPKAQPDGTEVPPGARAKPKPKAPPKPKVGELRDMIEAAYLRATDGKRSEIVRLSRLRKELESLDRETVDGGLTRILRTKKEKARLTQIDDRKAIDAAEAEAAFSPAGEPYHLIWIP